jgi:hypothetical protein
VVAPDRQDSGLNREQRVAAEVVRRLDLEPPVDVESAARHFADVDAVSIPGDCDGLVLGLNGGRSRPLILLDRLQPTPRSRFTLAHELGHVLLPWHVGGAFLCETHRVRLFDELSQADLEPEANRFAAELLVPSVWLRRVIAELGPEQVVPLMEVIRHANVSAYVACLRLREILPAGHSFVISAGGTVRLSGRTKGTGLYAVNPPQAGEVFERDRLDQFAHCVEDMDYGSVHVTWWTFQGEQDAGVTDDVRTARQVLDELLQRYVADETIQHRVRQSLGGVIGAAHGEARRAGITRRDALFVRFRGRFAVHRPDLPEELLRDEDFEIWLRKRAQELGE